MSDPSPSGETWVCRANPAVYGVCTSPIGAIPGHNGCGPVPSGETCCHGITLARVTERCAECGTVVAQGPAPLIPECCEEMWRLQRTTPAPPASPADDVPDADAVAFQNGYRIGVRVGSEHHGPCRGLPPASPVPPTRPGADAVIRALIAACPSYGRGEGDTFHIEESAVVRMAREFLAVAPPTPTPCPYIVTGGEGTSHCSLAERSAMHAAAPPSTPADPRPTDLTGSEA